MTEKGKEKRHLINSLADTLEIPQDVTGSFKVTLWGHDLLRLENHRGIIGYSNGLIICATGEGRIEISGAALRLGVLDTDELWIEGRIDNLEMIEDDMA